MGFQAVGAGASEGLGEMLTRMLQEAASKRADSQVAETGRHNLASEAIQGRQQDLMEGYRRDTLQEKKDAGVEKAVSMRGIGDPVQESEYTKETGAGVPQSDYKILPGMKVRGTTGFQSMPDVASHISGSDGTQQTASSTTTPEPNNPMNAPRSILFAGTGAQRQAKTTSDRLEKTGDAAIDAKIQQLQQGADRLESQGKLNEANAARAQAQAELDRVKAAAGGFAPKVERPLPSSVQDNMIGLNTAEVEGVKVLKALHSTGLSESNDPLDPRWNKFMVTTLKMAPEDWNKADIQQRTAAINAMLTRGLMGARPSQYVAQIIQQHLPQGDMTGKQLFHVLNNVLEQAGERRTETEAMTGRELGPKSGQGYKQWLEEVGGGQSQGGVPSVGGTFNGGKVLSVKPFPG